MSETLNNGVRIVFDVVGQGRPMILLGWCADRSWWTEPGYVDDLKRDHLVINVDIHGHGACDKPHEPTAYSTATCSPVADAERVDRFAIWGQSFGGRRMAWITANALPERVPAIITSGAWQPGSADTWRIIGTARRAWT
jgi:pimeloyl-ACP methyl ester carboxylesterase